MIRPVIGGITIIVQRVSGASGGIATNESGIELNVCNMREAKRKLTDFQDGGCADGWRSIDLENESGDGNVVCWRQCLSARVLSQRKRLSRFSQRLR